MTDVSRRTLVYRGGGSAATVAAQRDIIGREEELASLERFLVAVEEGAAALTIEGEAGIGKTTLWRAGVALARTRGYSVLSCSPAAAEAKLALAALGDLLEDALHEVVHELPKPQRRALRIALFEEDASAGSHDERALALAFLGVIRSLARRSRLVIAVDDAQWLDSSSAAVIEFAARRLRDEPVGLLVSVRTDSHGHAPLGLTRAWPEERLRRLPMGAMSAGALHRVVHTTLGTTFPRPTLHQLAKVSGGNPFYALEIARALQRRGALPALGRPLPLPRTLADLVQDRLAALPAETRAALLAASALREATVPLVAAATGVGGVSQRLQPAVEAHVIEFEDDLVRFTHPLLASEVYTRADAERRRDLHRRLAALVVDSEERARHLALSAEIPDAEVAAWLEDAAGHAYRRGASIVASELLEQAARFTPPERLEDLVRRTTGAADGLFAIGETVRGQRLLEDVHDQLAPGVARARVLQRLGTSFGFSRGWKLGIPVLRQAVHEAGDDAALAAAIKGDLSVALFHAGDLRVASRHARHGVRLATKARAPALGDALRALVGYLDFQRGLPAPVALPDPSVGAARGDVLDRPPGLYHAAEYEAMRKKWADDFDAARVSFELLEDAFLARERGGNLPAVRVQLAELECWAGNWQAAQHRLEDAEEAVLQTAHPARAIPYHSLYVRALLSAYLGHVDIARVAAQDALAETERAGDIRFRIRLLGVLGFLELSLGDALAAARSLDEAGRLIREAGFGEPGVFRVAADEIEALVGAGELARAKLRVEELEEQGRRLKRAWARATAGRCRALLAAAEGDIPQALRAVENALREHERLPQPLERARTLLLQGSLRRRAKQRRAARESLEEALAVFEHLGAALWTERARAELRRIGGRAPATDALTATEERVAALVVEGRTNREVADALFVTVRTVEANLSRIYRKLGVRSRSELAGRVARDREPSTL